MASEGGNRAASIKQRLLNLARRDGRVYEVVLVRYALERLLYRLSISAQRDRFILKGGMLVTLWLEGGNRETRDADFLGFGDADQERLRTDFAEIMAINVDDDGLIFDIQELRATIIREDVAYNGVRLRTTALLERTRIPVTIDIGFGDILSTPAPTLAYPSLLGMETPSIRTYPPAAVIAEKFQAMVALGVINGRMKDYFDLWAIPQALTIPDAELDAAISATFKRRGTSIPTDLPPGLSEAFLRDASKQAQWRAYTRSIQLEGVTLDEVVAEIWKLVGPSCARLSAQRH
ncbi:nucleotidyl transferase AbiEii/AbiGii toxin family protein [Mesorhizobium sp. M0598]|uniref:nucleotidyl transferase AbiEii/AbiGii toxin family protein n=1 Tax=Mesorhizobium sp. M0598 TaxID=2956968 RepID=UPI003339E742